MLQSQRFTQNNGLQVQNEEEFASVLNALLPEIEKQLMKDIERQLQAEFQEKYQKAIQEINKQALQQYQQAISQLEESQQILQKQKESQLLTQIQSLQQNLAQLEADILTKLQEKFLQQNFDQKVMSHQRILSLQKQIEEQIFYCLQQKHQATKQRQLKQLIIAHQTKQIKLRKQLDQQIKSRIYCSSGLEQLKQQIKQSKTQTGSQKSEYNLKLKKIQNEIKDYQQKIKEYEKLPNLEMLRQKYEELKIDLIEKQTERNLKQDEKKRLRQNQSDDDNERQFKGLRNDDSLDQNQQDQKNNYNFAQQKSQTNHQLNNQKTLNRQNKNQILVHGSQYIHNQQFRDQQQYSYSQNQSRVPSQQNSKKFDLTAYFKGYLLNSQTAKIVESQDYVRQQHPQKKSLLNLQNVTNLLKQKITMDPLQKYLNKESVSKQNDINSQNINIPSNQKVSNFAELYEQHLKNLNKGFARKSQKNNTRNGLQGLSNMAKKTIIKNLSAYHRNNFCNTKLQQKTQQSNVNNYGSDSYNIHESNLLSTYK